MVTPAQSGLTAELPEHITAAPSFDNRQHDGQLIFPKELPHCRVPQ